MPIVLQHRSMQPPLYVGDGCLVGDIADAQQFSSFIDAESFRWQSLGPMAPLYTPTEASPVTVSKNLRKTTRWKQVAEEMQDSAKNLETALRMSQVSYDKAMEYGDACKVEITLLRDSHKKAMQGMYILLACWAATALALVVVLAR